MFDVFEIDHTRRMCSVTTLVSSYISTHAVIPLHTLVMEKETRVAYVTNFANGPCTSPEVTIRSWCCSVEGYGW